MYYLFMAEKRKVVLPLHGGEEEGYIYSSWRRRGRLYYHFTAEKRKLYNLFMSEKKKVYYLFKAEKRKIYYLFMAEKRKLVLPLHGG